MASAPVKRNAQPIRERLRAELAAQAAEAGWPDVQFRRGVWVRGGEAPWRKFLAVSAVDELAEAIEAMEPPA